MSHIPQSGDAASPRGKRRDSIYSKKNLKYKRSTTGVEWSITGVEPEYEWNISGVEVEYELLYFTISHCTPVLLHWYSNLLQFYSDPTPAILHSTPVALHWYFVSRGILVEYGWSTSGVGWSRNSWSLAFSPLVRLPQEMWFLLRAIAWVSKFQDM